MLASALGIEPTAKSARMTKHHSLCLFPCQRLLCPLTYQIAFNLGRQPKCESENFALDVITQTIVVLDGPHPTLLRHTDIQYLHDHKEISSKSR